MLAIVAGFLFGLMTDRALLINNHGFFASLDDLWNKPGFDWAPLKFPRTKRTQSSFFHFSGERRDAKWMERLQCGEWNMTEKTIRFMGNQCVWCVCSGRCWRAHSVVLELSRVCVGLHLCWW